MDKTASAQRGPSARKAAAPKSVAGYIARVPKPALGTFRKLRAAILSAVPASAVEIISYGIPALKEKRVLVWYAAFSDHCSLFPTAAVIGAFKDELAGYSTSKGTIQFPLDKPLPTALVKRIVRERVRQATKSRGAC